MSCSFPSRAWAADEAEGLFDSLPYPSLEVLSCLRGRGVSADALCEPELPRMARVRFNGSFFDFVEAGDGGGEALVFLARDDIGKPADLVAWSHRHKGLAPHFGAVGVLGANDILAPRLTAEAALAVHRTPFEWLLAERCGVVILDPDRAAIELRDFGPFAAQDEQHGLMLRALFRTREPRIYVPERRAA
jgi:hypothetical protein